MNFLAVFIGGGLGSLTRYGISLLIQRFPISSFPIATLISNVLACVLMGVWIYYFKQKNTTLDWMNLAVITGFCGGFSTFSTFSYESLQLLQNGSIVYFVLNILLSLFIGLMVLLLLAKNL